METTRFATLNEAREYCTSKGANYHHTASAKGYNRKKTSNGKPYRVEEYDGKFGKGFIINLPNNDETGWIKSNNYYAIDYYIYGNK